MELAGLLLPILIDFITRKVVDSDIRFWVSVGICAVFGVFFNFLNTGFDFVTPLMAFDSITASILATFGIAQLSFKAVWEKTDIHRELRTQ